MNTQAMYEKMDIEDDIMGFDEDEKQIVNLICKDGVVKADVDIITQSELIKNILECDQDVEEINIDKYDVKYVQKVLDYLQYHKTGPKTEIEKPLKLTKCYAENLNNTWDVEFIESFDKKGLFNLILTVHYLDIKSLLDLACSKVAFSLRGKKREQIQKEFNLTTEDIGTIREETSWVDDV